MLPPEFLAEVAVAVCKGGLGGFNPGALADLAELTDLQILELLCKPPAGAEQASSTGFPTQLTEAPAPVNRPASEAEEFAQFMDIGMLLIKGGRCKFNAEEMQKYWITRRERKAAKANFPE
jgi:hypothetical protein